MVFKALLPKTFLALLPLISACLSGPGPSLRPPPRPPLHAQLPTNPNPGSGTGVSQPAPRPQQSTQAPVSPGHPQPAAAAQPPYAQAQNEAGYAAAGPPASPVRGQLAIALLLPLSGPYASSAESVRDGFMSGYFGDPGHPQLRVYDIGGSALTLRVAYQRALNEGATLIVGPLTKEDVAALASLAPPIPVLGLNYLDGGLRLPFNFFQFGLAPEDEARAAAVHALASGMRRALALVPNTEWGQRTLAAFDAAMRQGGGTVVRAERYAQGVNDQSKLIASLMGVNASEERHAALTAILGQKSEFEAQRRNDVDLVFVGARAQDARLLIPQLRFNRVGDLPIYATALVYDGKPTPDINGLRFCDAPWLLDNGGIWAAQRNALASLASAKASPRLFAMGRDAYVLATGLTRGSIRVGDSVDGASGHLEWSGPTTIARELDCVQVNGSSLQALR